MYCYYYKSLLEFNSLLDRYEIILFYKRLRSTESSEPFCWGGRVIKGTTRPENRNTQTPEIISYDYRIKFQESRNIKGLIWFEGTSSIGKIPLIISSNSPTVLQLLIEIANSQLVSLFCLFCFNMFCFVLFNFCLDLSFDEKSGCSLSSPRLK